MSISLERLTSYRGLFLCQLTVFVKIPPLSHQTRDYAPITLFRRKVVNKTTDNNSHAGTNIKVLLTNVHPRKVVPRVESVMDTVAEGMKYPFQARRKFKSVRSIDL